MNDAVSALGRHAAPSTRLRRPVNLLLPRHCPKLAALLQMLHLLPLRLPEVAAHHRVAVLVNAIDEVLACHADHATFPVIQVALVEKIPLLYAPQGYSTFELPQVRLDSQWVWLEENRRLW